MRSIPPLHCSRKAVRPEGEVAAGPPKAAAFAAGTNGEKMRVISQSELLRLTRAELMVLLRRTACELPDDLPEGSVELRHAHANLLNIRRVGRPEGSAVEDFVVEDHADHVLGSFKTQKEAIDWARKNNHSPLVARVRHLNDKKIPDHWRAA
jgi:hypothetical protein